MEAEREERAGNLARVAEIQYGVLPELEKELAEREERTETPMVKEEVDEDDIAAVVSDLDGDSRLAAARGRGREAHPHGGAAPPAGRRPGPGGRGGRERAPARALGSPGSEPADRLVHLPRADGRREDRARARARRVHVRRRARDGRGSTCPSTRSGTRSPGSSALRPGTSATRRAGSSRRPCGAARTRSSSSTRSRRRTPRCSTSCSSCSTTGG